MKVLGLLILTLFAWGFTQQPFAQKARDATAILYAQDERGGLNMRCTATAFGKTEKGYLFVSAAHCVGHDDTQREKVAKSADQAFYVTFDAKGEKVFLAAKVLAVGYQHRGDDFLVVSVDTKEDIPTIPIGDERKEEEGAAVLNIASPLGLGRQVFRGQISKLELDRPLVEGDINWKGSMLLQMPGTNGGSSGSAVISENQQAIVGFLVGTIGGTTITAIPATRFSEFQARVAAGTYRWMARED